jgi:hypothetical protein
MPGKKKKASRSPHSTGFVKQQSVPVKRRRNLAFIRTALNVLKLLVFLAIIYILIVNNKGYSRLYKYNVVRILDDIEKYGGSTHEEKMRRMLGADYSYLSFVRNETPEDAIILAPPRSIWHPEGKKLGFGNWITSKSYVSYFIYPRRVIYDDEKDAQNPLKGQLTHVMIVDHWGYEKLDYPVSNKEQFSVLPIRQ